MGCSCAPSPALITLAFSRLARNCGAPAEPWRSTRMSACNASRLRAVSLSVSPLVRLEVVAEILITSALKRKAASSNEVRVRVLGSTKKFISVFPRSAGTFLIWRMPTSLNAFAVSRTKLISSADNSRRPSKSLRVQRVLPGADPRRIVMIPFPARLRRVRCRFLAGAPEFVLASRSANFFRRNRGEWGARDDRDRSAPPIGCGRGAQTS